jgi:hypothetical protein
MHERPHIRRLIESVANRTDGQHRELARTMAGRSWPGGGADRKEPAAVHWLRRWAPRPAPLLPPLCSCAHGHCQVCN